MGQVNIALVGVGAMTQRVHLPSLASMPDVRLAGVCDLDTERMATVADHYGIERRFTDYRAMVEELAPDGVYAVGQPHLMYDVWVWCLQQGLNLFIEKPLGLSWHQAQMLTHLAAEHGVITQVGHQRRTSPLLVAMREACLARGPIVHAVCEFYKCDRRPFVTARDRMLDDGVHAIDTLRWICGGEVVGVESHARRVGVPDLNWVTATLQFDNAATGILIANWASGRRIFRVEMHGARDRLRRRPGGRGPVVRRQRCGRGGVRDARGGRQRRAPCVRGIRGQEPGVRRVDPGGGGTDQLAVSRRRQDHAGRGDDPRAGAVARRVAQVAVGGDRPAG